jgi:serine O-acetyltransferase
MLNAIHLYRLSHWLYTHHVPILPRICTMLIFLIYNSYSPASAKIGAGTRFGYGGMGVVIPAKAVIGKGCIIGQQVTIGGRSQHPDVPVLGDNVYLAGGSKVLGPIKLGDDVVVGANAVVIKDVPSNTVVAGVPAKVIRTGIKMADFI